MGFKFQLVLSPWVQETLYSAMMKSGQYHTMAFKRFVVDTLVEAAEDEKIVQRAVVVAQQMVAQKKGG